MGNFTSTEQPETTTAPPEPDVDEESVAASVIQKKWKNQQTDFQWHAHFYDEVLEMAEIDGMVKYLAHLFKVARAGKLKGLDLAALPVAADVSSGASVSSSISATAGSTKLLLSQLISIVENNKNLLNKNKEFPAKASVVLKALKKIGERTSSRKVSIVGLDSEKLQKEDNFFFLVKDDKLKRITLSFSPFAFDSVKNSNDWVNQPAYKMKRVALERALKAKISGDRVADVGIHQGFYVYLFVPPSPGTESKFDEIVNTLKPIVKDYPKHRIFVTGHGMGAAMGQILAFFLTFKNQDQDIPLPISSISFSTPRVGDVKYWRACQLMEIAGKLRTCRVSVAADSMPLYPSAKEYLHAGHQVLLEKGKAPKASYPTAQDDGVMRFTRFGKKTKDYKEPKDYLELIEANKEKLMDMHLNKLYEDIGVQSFRIKSSNASQKIAADIKESGETPPPESKPETATAGKTA
ncbi:hypothetical protein ACA910_008178 [Epithemia clementina (nom. ined.)]